MLSYSNLPPTQSYTSIASRYPEGVCLEFWYHMYGPHIGTLNVYVDTFGQKSWRWSKTGSQGNRWKKGSIYVNTLYGFDLRFEAVKGKGWSGDIALDDVNVRSVYFQHGLQL